MNTCTGCKEIQFYSLPLGQAATNIKLPKVILIRIIFDEQDEFSSIQFLCYVEYLKRTEFTI